MVIDNPDNDPLVVNDIDLSHDMETPALHIQWTK